MNLTEELMQFRTAYLQTIAKCWNDSSLYKEMISKKGSIGTNILETKLFKSFLPKNNSVLDWRVDLFLIENPNKNLAQYVPYNPNSLNGWFGGPDLIILKVPKTPEKNEQASALMSFYDAFTTFLGNTSSNIAAVHPTRKIEESMLSLFTEYTSGHLDYLHVIEEDILTSLGNGCNDTFFSLGSVYLDLVSMCWKNPDFKKYLLQTTLEPIGKENSIIKDEFIKFENPFSFNIKFQEAEDGNSIWDPQKGLWTNLENNEIFLQFPRKPENDTTHAQALARYNGTGPTYPLTCA